MKLRGACVMSVGAKDFYFGEKGTSCEVIMPFFNSNYGFIWLKRKRNKK